MCPASLAPSLDADVHLVLCDFGRAGFAYVETDPSEADATTVVRNLLRGEYERPLRVVALNADEGWARDVSERIAAKVQEVAQRERLDLTGDTRAFIEAHSERTRSLVKDIFTLWANSFRTLRKISLSRNSSSDIRPIA